VGSARRQAGKSGIAVICTPRLREALAVDLLLRGSPVEPETLTVGRIAALHEALLHDPASVTAQVSGGDGHTRDQHLLFLAVDELRTANWQRTKDGQKNRNRPKPFSPLAKKPGKRTGRTDRDPAAVMRLLKKVGAAPTTA
jgi:hypothetical protein